MNASKVFCRLRFYIRYPLYMLACAGTLYSVTNIVSGVHPIYASSTIV